MQPPFDILRLTLIAPNEIANIITHAGIMPAVDAALDVIPHGVWKGDVHRSHKSPHYHYGKNCHWFQGACLSCAAVPPSGHPTGEGKIT